MVFKVVLKPVLDIFVTIVEIPTSYYKRFFRSYYIFIITFQKNMSAWIECFLSVEKFSVTAEFSYNIIIKI